MAAFLCLLIADAASSEAIICTNAPTGQESVYIREITLPDESEARLVIEDAPSPGRRASGCRRLSIPVDAKSVAWASPLAPEQAAEYGDHLALQGRETAGAFEVSEIIGADGLSSPPLLSLAGDGVPPMTWRVFGVEERAAFDGRTLSCQAGKAPAGVVMFPTGSWSGDRPLDFTLGIRGYGRFSFGLMDARRASAESPLELGEGEAGPEARDLAFSVPVNPLPWIALSIACPLDGARLELTGAEAAAKLGSHAVPWSAWIWSAAAWSDDPDSIWSLQAQHGLKRVYITIPVEAGKVRNPLLLEAFVAEARRRGLEVWPVSGDPRDVLSSSHPALLARIAAYADYNRRAAPGARLAGIQLDIEPYLLPGYGLRPEAWRDRYGATVRKVRAALDPSLPLDLVMPVWWGESRHWGQSFLDSLAPLGVSITVMNYRTNPEALLAGARPFLEWSGRHGRPVAMAMETGPIGDETRRHYRESGNEGELWILPMEDVSLLVLLSAPATGLPGRAYRYSHATVAPGTALTFAGSAGRLKDAVDQVLPRWAAWRHFSGLAIHGLDAAPAASP